MKTNFFFIILTLETNAFSSIQRFSKNTVGSIIVACICIQVDDITYKHCVNTIIRYVANDRTYELKIVFVTSFTARKGIENKTPMPKKLSTTPSNISPLVRYTPYETRNVIQ